MKKKFFVLPILAFIGIFDTIYLLVEHFSPEDISCSITGKCDVVLTSEFSTIFGIPLSVPGILFYVFIFILSVFLLKTNKEIFLRWIVVISMFGFFASLALFFIQAFVLQAFCQYCLLSALITTIIFITSGIFLWKEKKQQV